MKYYLWVILLATVWGAIVNIGLSYLPWEKWIQDSKNKIWKEIGEMFMHHKQMLGTSTGIVAVAVLISTSLAFLSYKLIPGGSTKS